MRFRDKGFTLVELMVTVTIAVIVMSIAIPSFVGAIANTSANGEISEFYRALNFARSEAINRGVPVRVVPQTASLWTGLLNVQIGSAPTADQILRIWPAMRTGTVMSVTSTSGAATYIEFNNLGALNFPTALVAIGYTRGTQVRTMGVCLNGRVVSGGPC
ncbi:GspH/FimT family pseudopilin [Pseudomonas sp. dw_358]|uniref:GspH/FimT family pseudopilin n=1 Tax=Pseudomonas sp. dw_358 TaxID=2720083 RepID=UPI001BD304BD|nr:GspH/FimT family pseudopilin [Pseudomonas sp. dw_358]